MTRSNNFDGLRLIAAMAVLLSHMAVLGGEQQWTIQGQTWGTVGVLVFFSISGYLVMASWRRDPDLGRFLARRFLRIAPGVLVAAVAMFALVSTLGLYGFPDNPLHELNGSLWTISFEVQLYLLLVALAMCVAHPVPVGMLAWAVGFAFWPQDWMVQFAPYFIVGAALHEYPQLRRWSWALVGLGLATTPYRPMVAGALVVAPLAVWIGSRSWPVLRSAGRHGDLSYGVYIYAFPVQQIAVAYMGTEASYWALLAVSLPIVLALAWLSWRYVESPALSRKPAKPAPYQPAAYKPDAACSVA